MKKSKLEKKLIAYFFTVIFTFCIAATALGVCIVSADQEATPETVSAVDESETVSELVTDIEETTVAEVTTIRNGIGKSAIDGGVVNGIGRSASRERTTKKTEKETSKKAEETTTAYSWTYNYEQASTAYSQGGSKKEETTTQVKKKNKKKKSETTTEAQENNVVKNVYKRIMQELSYEDAIIKCVIVLIIIVVILILIRLKKKYDEYKYYHGSDASKGVMSSLSKLTKKDIYEEKEKDFLADDRVKKDRVEAQKEKSVKEVNPGSELLFFGTDKDDSKESFLADDKDDSRESFLADDKDDSRESFLADDTYMGNSFIALAKANKSSTGHISGNDKEEKNLQNSEDEDLIWQDPEESFLVDDRKGSVSALFEEFKKTGDASITLEEDTTNNNKLKHSSNSKKINKKKKKYKK